MGTETTKLDKDDVKSVQHQLQIARDKLPRAKLSQLEAHHRTMLGGSDGAGRLFTDLQHGTDHVNAAIDHLHTGLGNFGQSLYDVAHGIEESSAETARDAKRLADGVALIAPPLYQQHHDGKNGR